MLPRSIITTEAPESLAVIAAANGTSRADDRQAVTYPMLLTSGYVGNRISGLANI